MVGSFVTASYFYSSAVFLGSQRRRVEGGGIYWGEAWSHLVAMTTMVGSFVTASYFYSSAAVFLGSQRRRVVEGGFNYLIT